MLLYVLFVIIYSHIMCNRTYGENERESEKEGEGYGKNAG